MRTIQDSLDFQVTSGDVVTDGESYWIVIGYHKGTFRLVGIGAFPTDYDEDQVEKVCIPGLKIVKYDALPDLEDMWEGPLDLDDNAESKDANG